MSSVVQDDMTKEDEVPIDSGELVDATIKEAELSEKVVPIPRPPPPFPQRLVKNMKDGKYRQFITMLKHLSINVPFIEPLEQMPGHVNFMKDMVEEKKEDPGTFIVRCKIGLLHFVNALCDVGESINLMSLSIYKNLGMRDPKPTTIRLLMAD
ncbi:uncharacterized protein LOC107001210 [Solanum pennellii]|uniref:Uncharacterized protein LOC107001210 n=1 Tax=Solanum pennellii TaxID=28526 RepID=A0ABM1FCD6_SOLPN|nr:uncharacterized protein LOC107001210 [Solanum pennellii]